MGGAETVCYHHYRFWGYSATNWKNILSVIQVFYLMDLAVHQPLRLSASLFTRVIVFLVKFKSVTCRFQKTTYVKWRVFSFVLRLHHGSVIRLYECNL
jgi:hypothetical protein